MSYKEPDPGDGSDYKDKLFRIGNTTTLETYEDRKKRRGGASNMDDDFSQIDKYDQLLDDKLIELKQLLNKDKEYFQKNRIHLK
mmetsp:Transcript_5884/g.6635  ORF Transcript_5884/g.6635 Transcript_5884/m.6635 type:complete len:84 (+) Transcript_5884:220-471(+)